MTRRINSGWLVPLADLSLILFIVTGSTMATGRMAPARETGHAAGSSAQGVASIIQLDHPDAPSLGDLLAANSLAAGQQLTIEAHYSEGDRAQVGRRSEALAQQAMAAGVEPRVTLQPGSTSLILAIIAHDGMPADGEGQLAHGLQQGWQTRSPEGARP